MWAQTSSSEVLGSMGSEVSKVTDTAAQQDPREDLAASKQVGPHSTMHDAERPEQRQSYPTATSSPSRRGEHSRSPQRARSGQHFTKPGPDLTRQRDHYSLGRRSLSPSPVRRDASSDHLPNRQERTGGIDGERRQRQSSPISPERARYARSPRSPLTHRSSTIGRRPSPDPQHGVSHFNDASVSKYPTDRPTSRHAIWHAPGYQPPAKERMSVDGGDRAASAHGSAGKIEFNGLTGVPIGPKSESHGLTGVLSGPKSNLNGLTGVPTGPKSDLNRHADNLAGPIPAEDRPHIFLSDKWCPTLPTTHKHLSKFLGISESDIHRIPDRGWRIVFEASPHGRSRLETCYRDFHLKKLFSQYLLNMQRFPNGTEDHPRTDGSGERMSTTSERGLPNEVVEKECTDQLRSMRESVPNGPGLQTATDTHKPFAVPEVHTMPSEPAEATPRVPSGVTSARSSPLVARAEKDDSSSISALTGSDTSGSKSLKCHVCRNGSLSALDPLAHCTTCPRQYHRRCHRPKDTVPTHPDGLATWQCHRCVKKQVSPKFQPSADNLPVATPTLSSHQRGDHESVISGDKQGSDGPAVALRTSTQAITSMGGTQEIPTLPNSSEADDLVERMFAETNQAKQRPKKAGRLELIRRKLETPKIVPSDSQREPNRSVISSPATDGASQGNKRSIEDEESMSRKKKSLESTRESVDQTHMANGILALGEPITVPSAETGNVSGTASTSTEDTHGSQSDQTFLSPKELKVKPIPPLLRTKVSSDSSEPKINHHKWSGGGIDKAVIEDGFKNLFGHKPSQAAALNADPSGSFEQTADGVQRNSHLRREKTSGSSQQRPRELYTLSPAVNGVAASAALEGLLKIPGPDVKRHKLANAASGACAKCRRKIALNPSGSNIYCMKCKQGAAENSAQRGFGPKDASPALSNGTPVAETTPLPDPDASKVSTESGPTNMPGQPSGVSTVATGALSQPSPGKLKRLEQRTACDACRTHHKRCVHGVNGLAVNKNDATDIPVEDGVYTAQETPTKQPAQAEHDEGSDNQASSGDSEVEDGDLSNDEEANVRQRKVIKRRSFRTVAKDKYDLGNSYVRPKDTYRKLVAMALGTAVGHRMHSKDIVSWIAATIPGYNLKEGDGWEKGIESTFTQYRYQPPGKKLTCKRPLWYKHNLEPNGSIVEMMPGVEVLFPQWDPVLKRPVSPVKLDRSTQASGSCEVKDTNTQPKHRQQPHAKQDRPKHPVTTSGAGTMDMRMEQLCEPSPLLPSSRQPGLGDVDMEDVGRETESAAQNEQGTRVQKKMQESSDDEPLSRQKRARHPEPSDEGDEPLITARRRVLAPARGAVDRYQERAELATRGMLDAASEDVPSPPSLQGVSGENSPPEKISLSGARRSREADLDTQAKSATLGRHLLADTIKRDSENMDYSALSLFAEWPDYDPAAKAFDKAAKIAEIQARPGKKLRPRQRLSRDPWADPRPAYAPVASKDDSRHNSASFDRPTRSPQKTQRTSDLWQYDDGEANVTMCDSWEDFFDIPANPLPILTNDGQLAYRDGTKNEDGTLPRAKVIFKTGYA